MGWLGRTRSSGQRIGKRMRRRLLDGEAEALGGGVGFGGVLGGRESGDVKRPRRATPEALGLRRVSPLSIRRVAPCLRKLGERVSPLGLWMGMGSLWEAEAGLGLAEFWGGRKRRFSPQSKGGGQAAAKRPRRATPEALGLRRASPLSIRRGAPCLRKLVERVSPLGLPMGMRSPWEAEAGLGLGEFWGGRKRRFSPQSKGGGQAAAKRPCQATPEALGLRRVSPLSIRRGAPCLRKLGERVSPLGLWMGMGSLWEAEAGLGLAEFCVGPNAAILAAVQGRRTSRR